nr:unnamed protein product [Digitaria exilis]
MAAAPRCSLLLPSVSVSPAPAAVAEEVVPMTSPVAAAAPTRGRGLRRWRRIRREQEQHREGYAATTAAATAAFAGGAGGKDSAQHHKRRLPLPAGAPKGRHEAPVVDEAESSAASVESRFVPLDPGLGGLPVSPAGFSVGAHSDDSEDRGSWSSTAANAPRVLPRRDHALLFQREPRTHVPGASPHARNPRAGRSRADRPKVVYSAAGSTEAVHSRSSVESELRSSNSNVRQVGAGLNGGRKLFSGYGDHSDEEQPSEEVRSISHCKENGGSVVGGSVQISADSGDGVGDTFGKAGVGKGQNGRMHSSPDLYSWKRHQH